MKCEQCGGQIIFYKMTFLCESGHETKEVLESANAPSPPPTKGTVMSVPPSGSKMLMPFGKYKGQPVADLPVDYIMWVLENLQDLRIDLRTELQNQLDLKSGKGVVRKEAEDDDVPF